MEPTIVATARQLAEENGLDWRRIRGTGAGGSINEADVLDYLMRVMSGEEDLPEGSVDPIPATLEQDMAAMRSMIAGSGMADAGELDALMAQTPPPAPEPEPAPLPPVFEAEPAPPSSAPAAQPADDSEMLAADDFDFEMDDPLAASAADPLPDLGALAAPSPLEDDFAAVGAPTLSAAPQDLAPPVPEMDLSGMDTDVSALSDEDFAALMGDPVASSTPVSEPLAAVAEPEPLAAAAQLEHAEPERAELEDAELDDDFAASSAPALPSEAVHAEPETLAAGPAFEEDFAPPHESAEHLEQEAMAAPSQPLPSQPLPSEPEPLETPSMLEPRPALEEDYAALAGSPVLNEAAPVHETPALQEAPAALEQAPHFEPLAASAVAGVGMAGLAAASAPEAQPEATPAPSAPALAGARLSEVSLRVNFDVSALQEAALQLEPIIGQVSMGFFLARAVSRHAGLLDQSAVSLFDLEQGSFAALPGIGGDFRAALQDFQTASSAAPSGIAVAYAGELGLEEASSGAAAFTVSLGKPYAEMTGLTLRGEVSVQVGAAFLNAVADSLHKPITLLV